MRRLPQESLSFRRHPLRRLPHYIALATLHGSLLGLAYQTFQTRFISLAVGLVLASLCCVLVIPILAWHDNSFQITITSNRIIIDEGFPFRSRRIIERMYINQYRCLPNLTSWLTDSGTLELVVGRETIVLTALTPFCTLSDALEES